MPAFRYLAIDSSGQMQRGTMEARDETALIDRLQRQGQIPMRAEPASRGGFLADFLAVEIGHRRGLTRQDVANVTRELATMLWAGQDLDKALRFIVETAPNARVRTVMDRVRNKVRAGRTLAAALAEEPQSFPRLHVGLTRAGEAGGTLAETLDRLAALLERERSLAATIQSALIYPVLLIVAAIASIVLLLTQVLPEFVPLFEESGLALPTSTRMLMGFGNFIAAAGPWILAGMLVLLLIARQALENPSIRLRTDRLILRLPILGQLGRETLAARFCRALGTLLRNGVPLIAALGIVKEALGNRAAMAAIDVAISSAKGGAGLARPLGEAHIFPNRTVHLLRLGEETAQLASMALRAAEIHEEKTRIITQRLVSLMVPVITIVMGAAVAAIIGTLLTAMLSLNDLAT